MPQAEPAASSIMIQPPTIVVTPVEEPTVSTCLGGERVRCGAVFGLIRSFLDLATGHNDGMCVIKHPSRGGFTGPLSFLCKQGAIHCAGHSECVVWKHYNMIKRDIRLWSSEIRAEDDLLLYIAVSKLVSDPLLGQAMQNT